MLERLQVELPTLTEATITDERWLDRLDAEIEAVLDGLPNGQRRALELRFVSDFSYASIAEVLGRSPAAARIRVSRSLAWLRTQLEGTRP